MLREIMKLGSDAKTKTNSYTDDRSREDCILKQFIRLLSLDNYQAPEWFW